MIANAHTSVNDFDAEEDVGDTYNYFDKLNELGTSGESPAAADEHSSPTNDEFMRAIFGSEPSSTLPVVVGFMGNPNEVHRSLWTARPWAIGTLGDNANNYFSISTFNHDAAGKYSRRKVNFNALHVVVLDDIGTKIPAERVTLPATWQIGRAHV